MIPKVVTEKPPTPEIEHIPELKKTVSLMAQIIGEINTLIETEIVENLIATRKNSVA